VNTLTKKQTHRYGSVGVLGYNFSEMFMKIDVDNIDGGTLVLKEVFNSIVLETEEGNRFAICMRDDTVEMTVIGSEKWFRANMQEGTIEEL
jgi:hypothetical protein